MKKIALMALLLTLVIGLIPFQTASAQIGKNEEECDPKAFLTEAGGDLQTYGNALTTVDYTDPTALYDLYVQVMEIRHGYEDKVVCAELQPITDIIITVLTDVQDTLFFAFAASYDPENELDYAGMITDVVQPRNTANLEIFSGLAQELQ